MLLLLRNDPHRHPMLHHFLSVCKSDNENNSERKSLNIFRVISSASNAGLIISDDPIAFIFGWIFFRKGIKHRRFWALEIYEEQIIANDIKSYLRKKIFSIFSSIAFRLSDSVVFPSELRAQYAYKRHSTAGLLKKSKIVFNIPIIYLPTSDIPLEIENILINLRKDFKVIAIYSGSLQSGRGLVKLIENIENQTEVALVLCGRIKQCDTIINNIKGPATKYLGEFTPAIVATIYQRCDVGILSYENMPINTRLCAPVKLWEYLAAGLRIVGNDNYALNTEWSAYIDDYFGNNGKSISQAIINAASSKKNIHKIPAFQALALSTI